MKKLIVLLELILCIQFAGFSQDGVPALSGTVNYVETLAENGLLNGLKVCYGLDESAGSTVYDSHIYSFNCTNGGAVTYQPGNIYYSYFFDGLNDAIYRNGAILLDYPFSISLWFKWDAVTPSNILVSFSDGTTPYYHGIGIQHANDIMYVRSNGSSLGDATYTYTEDYTTWMHIVGIWESSSSRKLYLNGSLVASNTTNVTGIGYSAFKIGVSADSTPYGYTGGNIDQVVIWNRVLSGEEIVLLYSKIPYTDFTE